MKPHPLKQRQHPLYSPTALGATMLLLLLLGITLYRTGGQAFSPGTLSAISASQQMSGGFAHHADFGDTCTYCHEPFGGIQAHLCEECHTIVGTQRQQQVGLHGQIASTECALCHQEHQGANHNLFEVALTQFDDSHHALLFTLDGAHQAAACSDCHPNEQFIGTPAQCVGCHTEPSIHESLFGTDCVRCHTSTAWHPAQLTQHLFPLDHGGGDQIPCATCHESTFTNYHCVDCHTTVDMIETHKNEDIHPTDLANCVECHATGFVEHVTKD